MKKVILIATISILPGYEEEVKKAAIAMAAESNKEADCEVFQATTRNDSPGTIVIYEIYRSEESFEQHKISAHAQKFFELLKGKIKDDHIGVDFLTELNG
jgi:quinol monooxygenase YgiN